MQKVSGQHMGPPDALNIKLDESSDIDFFITS